MMAGNGTMNPFLLEVLETRGGELVLQCYQCGTCSGSCPVIDEMDYGPRRIMHLIQAGEEATVLSSKDQWRCVSCYSCANRCPRGIEITDLMADLRRMAVAKGYADDNEAEFGQAFAETVQSHGRLFEAELLSRYFARALDVASMIKMVPMGLRMFLKGKVPLLPERVERPEEIKEINVTDSTKLRVGTRLGSPKSSDTKKVLGGMIGGLLVALIGALLMGWRKESL
jgi:heterodisulfide reductase subunit C